MRSLKEGAIAQQSIAELEAWKEENDRLLSRLAAAERVFLRRREWLYGCIAAWIARRYDAIAWEGDLSIKKITEVKSKGYALEAAAKYRQFAAPYEFRKALRRAAAKYGAELIDLEAADTSRICPHCNGVVKVGAQLSVECENGHKEDQDVNAARLMLLKLEGASLQEVDLKRKGRSGLLQIGDLPKELRSAAIVIQPVYRLKGTWK
jgi:transposase